MLRIIRSRGPEGPLYCSKDRIKRGPLKGPLFSILYGDRGALAGPVLSLESNVAFYKLRL